MAKKSIPNMNVMLNTNVNASFIIILLLVMIILLFVMYIMTQNKQVINNDTITIKEEPTNFFTKPNYGYTNLPNDVLMNPYEAPLKDERYQVPSMQMIPQNSIPVNMRTNIGAVDTNYRQVGIMTRATESRKQQRKKNGDCNESNNNGESKEIILPLMGRPVLTTRDKWQYYTMTKNNIKLPIIRNGKNASNEYGVDEIFDRDVVRVEGYGDEFKVTMYENSVIRYLPLF
jgi:hypothetical protein